MLPITKNQIQKIHVLKSQLGWDDETYRAALESYGVKTCKQFDVSKAGQFIIQLQLLIPPDFSKRPPSREQPKKYAELGHRPGMASPAQLRKVEAMWADVSRQPDAAHREKALREFCLRLNCPEEIKWLEHRDVQVLVKAMNAMKGQKATEHKPDGGDNAEPLA